MKLKILLIEDDPDDIELLQEALSDYDVPNEMVVITDGQAALNYFSGKGHHYDIIILDLNLPKVHGREIIIAHQSSAEFGKIPLLILTTSSSADDISYALKNGASQYLQKPATVAQIKYTIEVIQQLGNAKLEGFAG